MTDDILLSVRYSFNTYIARAKGRNKTASYTGSAEGAVDSLVKKLTGDKPHTLKRCKNSNDYILSIEA